MKWRNVWQFAPIWLLFLVMVSQIYDMMRVLVAGHELGKPPGESVDALAILALIIEAASLFFLLRRPKMLSDSSQQ
jgi:ABC-type Fe3+-siderophore transport system permease subunit